MGFLCPWLRLPDEASREEGHAPRPPRAHYPAGPELVPRPGQALRWWLPLPSGHTERLGRAHPPPGPGHTWRPLQAPPPQATAASFLASQEWIDRAQSPPAFPLGPPRPSQAQTDGVGPVSTGRPRP